MSIDTPAELYVVADTAAAGSRAADRSSSSRIKYFSAAAGFWYIRPPLFAPPPMWDDRGPQRRDMSPPLRSLMFR